MRFVSEQRNGWVGRKTYVKSVITSRTNVTDPAAGYFDTRARPNQTPFTTALPLASLRERKIVGTLIVPIDVLCDLHQDVIDQRARAESEEFVG
jgi:hypothetical protein